LQGPRAVPFVESSDDDWFDALNVKLMGQVRCAREVFPHMVRQRWGRIINIGGTHGQLPSAYAMSAGMINAALTNFTCALAELGARDNVLVNLVSPGPIQTERTEYLIKAKAKARDICEAEASRQHCGATLLNRIGTVQEVTPLILLLASEQASYMTGALYSVDGGQYRAE
jgi:3-oxoacyl-[acyl-carrier protein] reductase